MKATRRCFISSALGGWVTLQSDFLALSEARAASAQVYVFAISNMRPHVLQKMLESGMPGVAVSVFGRVGDFARAMDEAPPDAAVAMTPVLEALGHKADMQGMKAGSAFEEYLVLS